MIKEIQMQIPAINAEFLNFLTKNWVWLLGAAVAVLLLIFFVIIPLVMKLRNKRMKIAETRELKNDLNVWDNLSALVRGGEDGRQARARLSSQLKLITMLFAQGVDLIKKSHRKIYSIPWFILLGEPCSGKSELIANSDAGFACSVSEQDKIGSTERNPMPLRCWLGSQAFILDVAGKVFMDRWLEGSSAEWNHFLRQLVRRRRRHPLDGILLVLPVDALLADSTVLARQKLDIFSAELQQLLLHTGQKLSCHVIITKMDMLTGFREYFADSDPALREAAFGWQNNAADGVYDTEKFSAYFEKSRETLRSAIDAKLMNPAFFRSQNSRIAVTGKLYQFPETFMQLLPKLDFFLNGLFGTSSWLKNDMLSLGGVYFTSSRDQGVTFSEKFAAICGKKLEEAPVSAPPDMASRTFFSKGVLLHQIHCGKPASFLSGTQLRLDLPLYIIGLLLLIQAYLWIAAPFRDSDDMRYSLDIITTYYDTLANNITQKDLDNSPLFAFDGKTKKAVWLNDKPMAGEMNISRGQFLLDAGSALKQDIKVCYGYRTARFFMFDLSTLFETPLWQRIFAEIYYRMVYLPAYRECQKKFQVCNDEPFTVKKKDAFFTYCKILCVQELSQKNLPEVFPLIDYLFPEFSDREYENFGNRYFLYKPAPHWTELAMDNFSSNNEEVIKQVMNSFLQNWNNGNIYPERFFYQSHLLLQSISNYEMIQTSLNQYAANGAASAEQLEDWLSLLKKQQSTLQEMNQTIHTLYALCVQANEPLPSEQAQSGEPGSYILQKYPTYERMLNAADEDLMQSLALDVQMLRQFAAWKVSDWFSDNKVFGLSSFLDFRKYGSQAINTRRQQLKSSRINYEKAPCFLVLSPQKGTVGTNVMFSDIQERCLSILLEWKSPRELSSVEDFSGSLADLETRGQKILARLNEYGQKYENPEVNELVKNSCAYLHERMEFDKQTLIREVFRYYPSNSSEFLKDVAKEEELKEESRLPMQLLSESIGKISIQKKFAYSRVQKYFEPLQLLFSMKQAKRTPSILSQYPECRQYLASLQEYIDQYMEYWGNYTDMLKPQFNSWEAFQNECAKQKTYEINQLLQLLYQESVNNLEQLPSVLMTPEQIKTREKLIAGLNARILILSPHFSQICQSQIAAWSTLPASANEAFHKLKELSPKQLQSDYFAVIATGKACDIPWWNSFFHQGAELLKKDAGRTLQEMIQSGGKSWLRFPLCADSYLQDGLDAEELKTISSVLCDAGFMPESPQDANKPVADMSQFSFESLQLADTLSPDIRKWGDQVLTITDALLNPGQELVWTVSVPDEAIRKKLQTKEWSTYPDAASRYRYWNITCHGSAVGSRVRTEAKSVFSSCEENGELQFDFYAFANDTVPSATYRLEGPWAILRLYLDKGGVFDPEKRILYAPLLLKDALGQETLFWVALTFNKKLPAPQQWPSLTNWPNFSKVQNAIVQKRKIPLTDWVRLVETAPDFSTLQKQLLEFDRGHYPLLTVEFAGTENNENPFFSKFRYMDMAVPGRKSQRIAVGKAAAELGKLELTASEIRFRFYRHEAEQEAAFELTVPGPDAALRLLTEPGRKCEDNVFSVLFSQGGISLPLRIKLDVVK